MATYHTTLDIGAPLSFAFEYVSNFEHTGAWDPRVSSARLVAGSLPVSVGTSFELISKGTFKAMTLPYRVVELEPLRRVAYEGEAGPFWYRDELTFAALDGGRTRLTYHAVMILKGIAVLASPVFALLFRRIGDDATRPIPAAVERAFADAAAAA